MMWFLFIAFVRTMEQTFIEIQSYNDEIIHKKPIKITLTSPQARKLGFANRQDTQDNVCLEKEQLGDSVMHLLSSSLSI